jgi:hypothetical protein
VSHIGLYSFHLAMFVYRLGTWEDVSQCPISNEDIIRGVLGLSSADFILYKQRGLQRGLQ